jgi:predicted GIY-YIG superfamily endonuclease
MSFWVYMLRCADQSYYTGHTEHLEKRLAEHQAGQVEGYTATRRPVTLVFSEALSTREEALACERRIKGWSRLKKEAMIRGDWAEVSRLARGGRPSTGCYVDVKCTST